MLLSTGGAHRTVAVSTRRHLDLAHIGHGAAISEAGDEHRTRRQRGRRPNDAAILAQGQCVPPLELATHVIGGQETPPRFQALAMVVESPVCAWAEARRPFVHRQSSNVELPPRL